MSEYRDEIQLRKMQRVALAAARKQRDRIKIRYKAKLQRQEAVIRNLESIDWVTGQPFEQAI